MNVRSDVERFVVDELLKGSKKSIGADESLIGSGVLDSLSWLQLVSYIEKHFGVRVEDEELLPEYFENVNAITAFVEGKLG